MNTASYDARGVNPTRLEAIREFGGKSTHVNFFTLETISAMVEKAGFDVVKKCHINPCALMPFLAEALDVSGLRSRAASALSHEAAPGIPHDLPGGGEQVMIRSRRL